MSSNIDSQVTRKIGIWSLAALVIGSQIGSGALSSPAIFAHFGIHSIYAWLIASTGALALAYVFARLCFKMPYTGGPHIYILEAFGKRSAFYIGWLYWMISWISTIVVLIACISYLAKAFAICNPISITLIGLLVWAGINYINLAGLEFSGKTEILLTTLKVLFFAVFIIIPFFFFESSNLKEYSYSSDFVSSISAALWGFIGIEVATTPAGSVENPSRNIPKAVILGTLLVAIIYCLANIAAIGTVHHSQLTGSLSPYDLIAKKIFGTSFFTNIMAFIMCLGSMNAWVLASGQIGLGLANDKILPPSFKLLRNGVPYVGILASGAGVTIIWLLGMTFGFLTQISTVIDALAPGFTFVYLICALAFIKFSDNWLDRLMSIIGIIFCVFLLASIDYISILITLSVLLSGLPLSFYMKKYQ